MEKRIAESYITVLKKELVPAMGCTEPIAIAFAAAKARAVLGTMPEKIKVSCSGNIIKNVKGVVVPNSGNMRGIEVAAILGTVGGDEKNSLEVLATVNDEHRALMKTLLKEGYCTCELAENVDNLYVEVEATKGKDSAVVVVSGGHTNITLIKLNGEDILRREVKVQEDPVDWKEWSIKGILEFVETGDLEELKPVIDRQVKYNTAISQEGLNGHYGTEVGRTMLGSFGRSVYERAEAYAAAGSDARMNGSAMPVIINSGSGNQGITVSLPVLEFAKELKSDEEKTFKALVLSNLVSIYLKHFIGKLSAFCGAVTAAGGAGAGITYLRGGDYETICMTIINTTCNVGGIICDGAKSSCAAKIASSVHAASLASDMAFNGKCFKPGEGLVKDSYEETIRDVGYVGRVGMKTTDVEILNIMLDKTDVD